MSSTAEAIDTMNTIYRIDIARSDTPAITLLVSADTIGQARQHARELIKVRKASQQDLVTLLGQGVKVEQAAVDQEATEIAAALADLNIQED